jgi:hypothetical protein
MKAGRQETERAGGSGDGASPPRRVKTANLSQKRTEGTKGMKTGGRETERADASGDGASPPRGVPAGCRQHAGRAGGRRSGGPFRFPIRGLHVLLWSSP